MFRRALILGLLAVPPVGQAQPTSREQREQREQRDQPTTREQRDPRRVQLDRLFEALRDAPDEAGGALVEQRIRAFWAEAASPAAVLLLRRGVRNMAARVPEEALEDFDAAIVLTPGAAEAWVLRAQAHATMGDAAAAARDLQEALRLEPRHFGALMLLSTLQEERGDHAAALRSVEAALALHPKLRGAEQRRRDLRRRAFGEEM